MRSLSEKRLCVIGDKVLRFSVKKITFFGNLCGKRCLFAMWLTKPTYPDKKGTKSDRSRSNL